MIALGEEALDVHAIPRQGISVISVGGWCMVRDHVADCPSMGRSSLRLSMEVLASVGLSWHCIIGVGLRERSAWIIFAVSNTSPTLSTYCTYSTIAKQTGEEQQLGCMPVSPPSSIVPDGCGLVCCMLDTVHVPHFNP